MCRRPTIAPAAPMCSRGSPRRPVIFPDAAFVWDDRPTTTTWRANWRRCADYYLTPKESSFRFHPGITQNAVAVVAWKSNFGNAKLTRYCWPFIVIVAPGPTGMSSP